MASESNRLEPEDYAALDEFLWGRRIGSDEMDRLILRLSNESKILNDFEDQLNELIEARGRQNAELDYWLGSAGEPGAANEPEPPETAILTGDALMGRIITKSETARRVRRGRIDVVVLHISDGNGGVAAYEDWLQIDEDTWKLDEVRKGE